MPLNLKTTLKNYALNLPGWHTNRKIVVIESDDWGSVRMASVAAREQLRKLGHPVASSPYHELDGLEKDQDIEALTEALDHIYTPNNSKAKITLNNSTANPDFSNIREAGFEKFIRQPFDQTYQQYEGSDKVVDLIKSGIEHGVFEVQYHGAEHLQTKRWLKALQGNGKMEREAFNVGVFSPAVAPSTGYSMEYMDALDYDAKTELQNQYEYLEEGYTIFIRVWGYAPKSFIAPCYRWSSAIEDKLKELGVKYIQGQRAQLHPKNEVGYRPFKIYHYTGEKSNYGQIYTVRNVIFEPSLYGSDSAIGTALQQIKTAFFMRAPAILSSHRINYTSRLSNVNRDQGIIALKTLLKKVIQRYPDVIFMSSSELGTTIEKSK